MKIQENKISKIINIDVEYIIFFDDQIHPVNTELTFTFTSNISNQLDDIQIKGLDFESWLLDIIHHRLVCRVESEDQVSDLVKYFKSEPLFVQQLDVNYICSVLFHIIKSLLPEGIEIESLEYK